MAKFYGTVQGERGEATRLGHHSIVTHAASWKGAIRTEIYEHKGETFVRIDAVPWRGVGARNKIFDGPLTLAQSLKTYAERAA